MLLIPGETILKKNLREKSYTKEYIYYSLI